MAAATNAPQHPLALLTLRAGAQLLRSIQRPWLVYLLSFATKPAYVRVVRHCRSAKMALALVKLVQTKGSSAPCQSQPNQGNSGQVSALLPPSTSRPSLTGGSTRTPTWAMPSAFSWPMSVPSALRAPAPVNLGVRLPLNSHYFGSKGTVAACLRNPNH